MTYKSGETPQVGDSVMGAVEGAVVRGLVARVGNEPNFLLQRRADYAGPAQAPQFQFAEVPAADFTLVYRKPPLLPAAAVPPKGGKKK